MVARVSQVLAAAVLAAATTASQASLVVSNGGALLEENFNGATSFTQLVNAAWVPGTANYVGDDFLRLAPGIMHNSASASLIFETVSAGSLDISFYYGFQAATAIGAWMELDGQQVGLPHTAIGAAGFTLLNPGADNTGSGGSELDVSYSTRIAGVAAGQHTLRFFTAGGERSDFRVDDLKLVIYSVPEPSPWMLLLLGLGLIAGRIGQARRRTAT